MSKKYTIIYALLMIFILLTFVLWKNISDTFMLLLAAIAFILTSIYTYKKRKK